MNLGGAHHTTLRGARVGTRHLLVVPSRAARELIALGSYLGLQGQLNIPPERLPAGGRWVLDL